MFQQISAIHEFAKHQALCGYNYIPTKTLGLLFHVGDILKEESDKKVTTNEIQGSVFWLHPHGGS